MKEYNIKTIRQDFKEKGIFYTTKDLAAFDNDFMVLLVILSQILHSQTENSSI